MAKSQENGSTILLRLKGYEVERLTEEEEGLGGKLWHYTLPYGGRNR